MQTGSGWSVWRAAQYLPFDQIHQPGYLIEVKYRPRAIGGVICGDGQYIVGVADEGGIAGRPRDFDGRQPGLAKTFGND